MLPGPRLLIRAVLLLGTARCSSASPPGHPDMSPTRPWGPPARSPPAEHAGREGLIVGYDRIRSAELFPKDPKEIQNHLGDPPRTQTEPSWEPKRSATKSPSEPSRAGTDLVSGPIRTGTDLISGPIRTGTDSLSEPIRTGTKPPSEPIRTGTKPPSEPIRTGTDSLSEPIRTGTDSLSESIRTGTDSLSEPIRTGTDSLSEPIRTGTDSLSEPIRTGTNPLLESNRTGTGSSPEPNRSATKSPIESTRTWKDPLSEPTRNGTDSLSELRTRTNPPLEPVRIETHPSSELNRTGAYSFSEPIRAGTDPLSELSRTRTDPPSEPNRTGTEPSSEPNRTDSPPILYRTKKDSENTRTDPNPPPGPNRTGTDPLSEDNRTDSPSPSPDTVKNQTHAEPGQTEPHLGPDMYDRSDPDWMQMDMGQTSSVVGITQKSATQRHLNKRTPHMDTTYISTTRGGDRTLLSVTNDTNVSDITQIPNMYPMNNRSHKPWTGSRNITEESPTTARGYRNATEDAEVRNPSSQAASSVPGTYPLQTPSYVVTTYPSPTSHHMSNSTFPFTSVPVTAPNTRGSPETTGVTSNISSIDPSSSSPSDVSGVESSSSMLTLVATTSVPSSSLPVEVITQTQQLPVSSSSPVPSTFVSAARSSVSPSIAGTSSNPDTTETPRPATAVSSTPGLPATSTYLPPFLNTGSTTGDGTEKNGTLVSSISPTANPTSMVVSPETPGVVTERRSQDETMATAQDVTTMETPTTVRSTEGTQRVTVGTRLIGVPTQTMDYTPSPTSTNNNPPAPSLHDTTPKMAHDTMRTAGTPGLTTADREVGTERTTLMECNTQPPMPDTTVSTKGKKILPTPTPPSTTPTVRHEGTTVTIPPATTQKTPTAAASPCSSSPCQNGGLCKESRDLRGFRCDCPAAWSGDLCNKDVDECLSSPCPALSKCLNSRGSFSCQCPLGYLLEKGAGCVLVRTFLGHIQSWSFPDGTDVNDIVHIMNSSFAAISGYYQSTVTSDSSDNLIIQNLFSLESNVTMFDLSRSLQSYFKVCETSPQRPKSCRLVLHLQHHIRALSLCHVINPGCDNETSVCADPAGIAFCQCKLGYFKYSKTDHSCRACDDGYKLESGSCVRCPFGLGGFNCSNPYQLITVIIAAAGGGLLLILVVALTVTCCRKSKHDISKLIFKSGDFQMSPYAEYPKTQRSSEWGREAIEMQENGSTKNLLQMTDVYYPPGLRNSELERNGLYPYGGGLPGSRHSCIYPGQYNPSFINEENRRRDYF